MSSSFELQPLGLRNFFACHVGTARVHRLIKVGSWGAWAILSTCLLCTAMAASLLYAQERKTLARELDVHIGLTSVIVSPTKRTVVETQRDFTADLPTHADVPAALAVLQRSCAAAGVTLQEIRVEERKPSIRELGLAQLTLQLRGTYPNIKQVLIDLQGHFAALTVRHLDLHRSAPPSVEAEGTATLAIWARPLTPPPPTSSPTDPRVPGSS